MDQFADASWLLDLHWLGEPEYIATAALATDTGVLLIDPGPTTALQGLEAALEATGHRLQDVQAVLLTHIHLDHAGVTGTLASRLPDLQIYVHERGARHLLDPTRLLASASRLYGDDMDRLWGDVLAVPVAQLHALRGGETLFFGQRQLDVAYTPGHAWHHVSYLDQHTGTAFVGDVAGERFPGTTMVLPALPPPDIDLGELEASIRAIAAWKPNRIFLTHFGSFEDVEAHFRQYEGRLDRWGSWVRERLDRGMSDEKQAMAFTAWVLDEYKRALPPGVPDRAHRGTIGMGWDGLARYWRKAE